MCKIIQFTYACSCPTTTGSFDNDGVPCEPKSRKWLNELGVDIGHARVDQCPSIKTRIGCADVNVGQRLLAKWESFACPNFEDDIDSNTRQIRFQGPCFKCLHAKKSASFVKMRMQEKNKQERAAFERATYERTKAWMASLSAPFSLGSNSEVNEDMIPRYEFSPWSHSRHSSRLSQATTMVDEVPQSIRYEQTLDGSWKLGSCTSYEPFMWQLKPYPDYQERNRAATRPCQGLERQVLDALS